MKKKRILAACLSTFMTISSMVTPFLSVPAYAAETHNSFTENGTSDIPISCEVKSGYKVVLPAQVALDKDTDTRYTKSFSPGVIGNIDYDKFVIVRPKDNFYALNDVLSIRSVEAEVSQNDVSWSADELGSGESIIEKDASTEAELNLAGSYSGEIQYEFFLSNEDVEPANTSGLQLSLSGVNVSENETVNVAMGSSVNIEATMNGEAVDNSQIEFETDNEHVQVDPDGDIVISSRAIPGETATITASINTNVAKANNVLKYLDKAGILSNVCAAPKTTTSFTVKVIDIHMNSEDLTNIDALTVHPGDKVVIEANVEPADADVDIMWTKTCVGGALTKISNNSVRLAVANDAEIGSSFDVIANIGTYAKLIKIKVDHEYSETIIPATCTEKGSIIKTCSCGKEDRTEIPALGHTYGSITYNWSDDKSTCTASKTCSTCSHVDTETVNTTNEVTTAATCTEAGVRAYTATFTNSAFKAQNTTVAVSAVGHKSVSANNAVAATCTTAGKESDTKCSVCGVTLTTGKSIPALGHSYGEYSVTKAATCTEDGSKARTCSVCGNVDTAVITKLGHDYASTFTVDKAATCIEAGSKSKHCSRCNSKSEITSIPALGHTYGSVTYNWSDDKSTCTASRTCSTCSHVDTETVNTTNEVTTAATCTEAGVRAYTATFTNSAFKAQNTTVAVSAAGHNYKNGKCTICKEADPNFVLEAGLYDANDNLLCTWEESGINVREDYRTNYKTSTTSPYYVLTNNYPTATKIVISNSVCNIDGYAFIGCSDLTNITIGDSISSIGNSAFYYCTNLTDINVGTNNAYYSSVDGVLFNKNITEIIACPKKRTSYIIPDSVIRIRNYAFNNCTNLTSITIPDGVTSIEERTFYNCTSLTSVTIGSGVTRIERQAFEGCSSLASLTISNSVTSIGDSAFKNCSSLTNITIPDSVTNIGQGAFSGCSSLTSATFETSGWYVGSSAGAKATALSSSNLANKTTAATYLTSTYYGKYWTRVKPGLYDANDNLLCTWEESGIDVETNYTSSTYRTSTTSPYYVINNKYYRTAKVIFPDDVTSIGGYAFYNCSKLTSITIPDSVTSIGGYAFSGCSKLTSATFKITSGWRAGSRYISSSQLINQTTAATCLRSTYSTNLWTRTN